MDEIEANVTVLTRRELFDQIWKTPASKLAKKFGLSDVGLAKICRRHQIPRPARGHWAKLGNGKRVRRPALRELDNEALEEVHIFRSRFFGGAEVKADGAPKKREVVVPITLEAPHSLIATTRKYLHSKKCDETGLLRADRETCVDVSVSPACLDRALRIFDSLIKEWELIAGKVFAGDIASDRNHLTIFELHEDRISVGLTEEVEPIGEKDTDWRRRRRICKYRTTGKLVLQIGGAGWDGHRRRWADGKRQRLETMLEPFILGLIAILDSQKLERLDNECIARQRQRLREVRDATKRRHEQEEQRRARLAEQIIRWQKASDIRAYLEAVRKSIENQKMRVANPTAFKEWMDWATWYADQVDPLTPTPPRPESLTGPCNVSVQDLDLTRHARPVVDKLAVKDTDELFAVEKAKVTPLSQRWGIWGEICRVLECLGYDVSGRYHDWC